MGRVQSLQGKEPTQKEVSSLAQPLSEERAEAQSAQSEQLSVAESARILSSTVELEEPVVETRTSLPNTAYEELTEREYTSVREPGRSGRSCEVGFRRGTSSRGNGAGGRRTDRGYHDEGVPARPKFGCVLHWVRFQGIDCADDQEEAGHRNKRVRGASTVEEIGQVSCDRGASRSAGGELTGSGVW